MLLSHVYDNNVNIYDQLGKTICKEKFVIDMNCVFGMLLGNTKLKCTYCLEHTNIDHVRIQCSCNLNDLYNMIHEHAKCAVYNEQRFKGCVQVIILNHNDLIASAKQKYDKVFETKLCDETFLHSSTVNLYDIIQKVQVLNDDSDDEDAVPIKVIRKVDEEEEELPRNGKGKVQVLNDDSDEEEEDSDDEDAVPIEVIRKVNEELP
jgi:hypothetical protein